MCKKFDSSSQELVDIGDKANHLYFQSESLVSKIDVFMISVISAGFEKWPWLCWRPYEYFIPYAYGTYHTRIRVRYDRTRMVWLFVPYAYSYYSNYTTIAVHKQHKYIGIANTVLLFFLDHELYP